MNNDSMKAALEGTFDPNLVTTILDWCDGACEAGRACGSCLSAAGAACMLLHMLTPLPRHRSLTVPLFLLANHPHRLTTALGVVLPPWLKLLGPAIALIIQLALAAAG